VFAGRNVGRVQTVESPSKKKSCGLRKSLAGHLRSSPLSLAHRPSRAMSDRSRSPPRAWRTEADLDRADLAAALRHGREVGYELADVRAELAAERAALATERAARAAAEAALAEARRVLEAERACRAADQDQAAERRRQWLDALRTSYRELSELAVLARRAGASGDLVEYWYTARTAVEPEPEAEPEPE